MLLFEGVHAMSNMLIPYATGKIIQSISQSGSADVATTFVAAYPLTLFAFLCAVELLSSRLSGAVQARLGPVQRVFVTRSLYAHLQRHSLRYFHGDLLGSVGHRVTETSFSLAQVSWSIVLDFWPLTVVFIVAIAVIGRIELALAAFLATWSTLFIATSLWLASQCRSHTSRVAAARSESAGAIADSLSNIATVKAFARESLERERLSQYLQSEAAVATHSNLYSERVRLFYYSAAAVLKLGMITYAYRSWAKGSLAIPDFVVAVTTALLIITHTRNLSRRFLEFFESWGTLMNGLQAIIQPHEIEDEPDAHELPLPLGAIEFRKVHFGYSAESSVFRDLSFTIAAGERVGMVGISGVGKSTIFNLLLRLYEPLSGEILIDGVDIRTVTQSSLRSRISSVPQEAGLFHRSLGDNIRYGNPDASDHQIVEAAKKANADEFVRGTKEGYRTLVGERGVKLSGGQRQRIAIARALLKAAPILIFDEATSSVDSITEYAIRDTLRDVMARKTVIVVAHRLSTVADLDRILVLEHGRVAEQGTHTELLARRGLYHRMWLRQSETLATGVSSPAMGSAPATIHAHSEN
jgi:ATP-binding cassette subfamily B protein